MELRNKKRVGERLDSGRPEKNRRTASDYRREAGLPEAEHPEAEHPAILKKAWAIDKTRSEFDKEFDLLLIKDHAIQATTLIKQLKSYFLTRDEQKYNSTWEKMEEASQNNHYVKKIMDTIRMNQAITVNTNRILDHAETQFQKYLSHLYAFTYAKMKFDTLASAIKKRDQEAIKQIEEQLKSDRSINKWIEAGMTYYEGVMRLTEEKEQHAAIVSARKQEQEDNRNNDSMELD